MRPFKIGELTERDLKRLAFIRRVKLMGFPLEKIKDLAKMRRAKRTLPAELRRAPGEALRRASPCAVKIQPTGGRR